MRKELVESINRRAKEVAKNFSNPDREYNFNKEMFSVNKIIPLSETTAVVIFEKQPSGKKALTLFYNVRSDVNEWRFFFPTYDHIVGFNSVIKYLQEVEQHNFEKN